MLINLNEYIYEKLHLNKDINTNINIETELLNILNPKNNYDNIKKYIHQWIKENNIYNLLIYINDNYKDILKKVNNIFEVKYFHDIDSEPTKFLRDIYKKVNSNWYFIGNTTGLGFKDNYFSYVDKEFTNNQRIYIIGNPDEDENIK